MKNQREKTKFESAALLKQAGLKITPVRTGLVNYFRTNTGPQTANQVHQGLANTKYFPNPDRATLFRNLNSLVQQGILHTTEFGTGARHFFLASDDSHRHHVYCVKCEVVRALDVCGADRVIQQATKQGFKVISHRLDVLGVCKKCS
jgi:Fur family transcriptional regulator, peroxide stress response regulator